ncbi:anti-sigma factor family protein [Aeromicrobium endophyticum]|uniref:Zf-HC2 domain-containing protein n=1 Tax=Aeromicrobium endophyticum TaxID=2292704 RepID=A0A371P8S6_9ACTN|nr:zf-HC2 domain-containing protein [Aeromicrobium endophyticum]REK72364.1 zf-HC2 domain-containing protein [Aeromicrobium endophyticum]
MTSVGNVHDELREALGAYALGQLDEGLRRDVDLHLATCETCPAELAEIGPVVRALRTVDVETISDAAWSREVPPGLDERIRQALPRRGGATHRRRRVVGAAATAVAVAAAVVITAVVVRDDPGPTVIAVPQVTTAPGVTAAAGLVDHSWGVEVKLRASGLAAGERFRMWVVADDGTSREAGEFVGVAGTEIVCDMSSSVLLDHATAFRVTDDEGTEVISAAIGS